MRPRLCRRRLRRRLRAPIIEYGGQIYGTTRSYQGSGLGRACARSRQRNSSLSARALSQPEGILYSERTLRSQSWRHIREVGRQSRRAIGGDGHPANRYGGHVSDQRIGHRPGARCEFSNRALPRLQRFHFGLLQGVAALEGGGEFAGQQSRPNAPRSSIAR